MILSVSRRTDIPNYYSDWFLNRIKEGFLYVRNPMNTHQISSIKISPEVIDCIVFWTKNPDPMIPRLDELQDYKYYFQFTLTGYGKDIECNVLHKKKEVIPIFQKLSRKIGSDKVIWRYDPIIFTDRYTPQYHINAFQQISDALKKYTNKCVISFVDIYTKNKKNMEGLNAYKLEKKELIEFVKKLQQIAKINGMELCSCAEKIDLEIYGVKHNCCIDKQLIEKLNGCKIKAKKDKNQRKECGCIESIEVGTYNTCRNACKYCYANYSMNSVMNNCRKYDPFSPLLCGKVMDGDKINERKVQSLRDEQISLFDI